LNSRPAIGKKVKLSDFRAKHVVLYFYPKDMTPGCTTESCDFRDHSDDFKALNTIILGISPDSISRHQKFIEKYNLPFLLLADETHQVAEEFMGIERSTFVLNKEGILVQEWRKVRVKEHVEEALQYI
jgi:peroxiredoxin Q/BCP